MSKAKGGAPVGAQGVAPGHEAAKPTRQRKGGGPETPAGKAAFSRNATTHGLASIAPVIPGERLEDWIAFRDGIIESLLGPPTEETSGGLGDGPPTPIRYDTLERALAARIASLFWRAERVVRYETAAIIEQIVEDGPGNLFLAEQMSDVFAVRPPEDEVIGSRDGETQPPSDRLSLETLGTRAPAPEELDELDEDDEWEPDPEQVARAAELRVIPRGFHLDRILRYEPHIHRMLTQTLHELDARQAR